MSSYLVIVSEVNTTHAVNAWGTIAVCVKTMVGLHIVKDVKVDFVKIAKARNIALTAECGIAWTVMIS